jgi:hypothetical protein
MCARLQSAGGWLRTADSTLVRAWCTRPAMVSAQETIAYREPLSNPLCAAIHKGFAGVTPVAAIRFAAAVFENSLA